MDDAFENSILKLKTFLLACYLRLYHFLYHYLTQGT